MDFKQFFQNIGDKLKALWNKGKIQKTSRITYDVVWNIILFFIIVGSMTVIFAGGVGAGYFASLVKDEPIRDYDEMKKDIYNYEETSKLYFANNKYIGDIRADLHREEVDLENVSELLTQAVVATEDELFYEHKGVVPKAIVRALYQEVSNSETKTGGSTLTQQLIKNQILTNEVSFERKAKEILLALRLENFFEKDEILEAYLNIVPYGRDASGQTIAGIQTAAKGVFGVDAKDLNLPQAAFLAGIPQNPYAYTPFQSGGELKDEEDLEQGINRMKTVLKRMYQTEFITEKEYKEAIEYNIVEDFAEKSASPIEKYPSVVLELEKRAKEILTEVLAEEDGYSMEEIEESEELQEQYEMLADRALRMNGYHIHSTIDKKMFDEMQKVAKDYQYYGPDRTIPVEGEDKPKIEQVEVGAVIIENKTGKILSYVPGRDFQAGEREVNYATGYGGKGREPGSTFKPLSVYAPAMELGYIQPGSVIADVPGLPGYSPKNYGGAYYGLVSAREALTYSYNTSTAEIYKKILHEKPEEKYLKKMGISLPENLIGDPSIALGTNNVTVEQNTNAFSTFGNGGKFNKSYMIEKITDSDGNIIYEHEPDPVEVFSAQTAYLTIDMMRDVIRSGTGAYVPSQLKYGGVDWAGKTGTSQEYRDAWFVGTNPNVTVGVWLGYDTPSSIYCSGCSLSYSQRTQKIWAQLVNAATDINSDVMAPKEQHKRPDGIVSRSYCATSGMAPSDLCSKAGLVRSDIYNSKYVPNKTDDSLVGGNMALVEIDGEQVVAGPNTPSEFTTGKSGGFSFNPEFLKRMGYDRLGDLSVLIPRKNPEPWKKIGFKGGSASSGGAIENDNGASPPAPGSLQASGNTITWSGAKGHLIVGYRIYHTSGKGGSAKLIGHTIKPSYAIPSGEGSYHVRAVNYFGRESEPSKTFTIEIEGNDKEKEDKDKEAKKAQKEQDKAEKEKQKEEEKQKKEEEKKKQAEEKEKEKEKGKEKEKEETENNKQEDEKDE